MSYVNTRMLKMYAESCGCKIRVGAVEREDGVAQIAWFAAADDQPERVFPSPWALLFGIGEIQEERRRVATVGQDSRNAIAEH